MNKIDTINRNTVILSSLSLGLLIFAFYTQFFQGLQPCKLCVLQRWPHIIVVLIGLHVVLTRRTYLTACYLAIVSMLVSVAISTFHFGIEMKLWPGLEGCSGVTHLDDLSPEEFLEKLLETPVARCDEASWLFLNISMAGWNAVFSILLTFFWGYNTLICKNALKS